MFALGYAFCLKVGEAICPQKSLKDFCLALGRVFNDALPDVQCQLLIKATPEASWEKLADMANNDSTLSMPTAPLAHEEQMRALALIQENDPHFSA